MENLSDYLMDGAALDITVAVYRGIRCEYYMEKG